MARESKTGFGPSTTVSRRLRHAAEVAVGQVLRARRGERVLIITNPSEDVRRISMALYDAAIDAGAEPTLVFQPVKSQLDLADDAVIHALRSEPEMIVSISRDKLGKDRFAMKKNYKYKKGSFNHIFNYLLGSKKSRAFWSPSVTVKMFESTIPVDYKKLRDNCGKLTRVLDRAAEVHIATRLGTDLVLGLRGRKARTDDGDFSKPGSGGNLPAGEVFISPELGTGEGTLVYDGSISSDRGVILIKKPIEITVRKNLVTGIRGGREASQLKATLDRARKSTHRFASEGKIPRRELGGYIENIRNLGELGIGLNEKARIGGNMLEDEKVFKTCHIAIGSNYDDDAKALIHLDGLIKNPTMTLIDAGGRRTPVMKNGKIII
ncbi:MAG: peptidase M17 [Candidatus Eisenbacteria bacterium]